MLRLLAQGEQGYADIAALMGLSEEEVRAKVVGALAQLQAEGKPAPDVPPPIPGGAHPAAEVAPPEPAAEPPTASDEDAEPAVADAVAPSARTDAARGDASPADGEPAKPEPTKAPSPEPPAPSPPKAAPASAPKPAAPAPSSSGAPSGGRTITLPTGRKAWLVGGGLVAAIAAIVVVILLISGGGNGGSSTESTAGATTADEEGGGTEPTVNAKAPTEAELKPVDGSEAEGRAGFGRVKNKLALQIEATGLAPTTAGTSYAIWLAQSPRKMIPLASTAVAAKGKAAGIIAAQFEVPLEILGYLASGTFDQIAVTKVENKPFEASVALATKRKKTPTYLGEAVLRGTITGPIVGLALREEEKKAEEEGG
jgi:hypothetical protein